MQKFISYPLTVLYFVFFGLCLLVFHPIQWFCLKVFGYDAHKRSVTWLNWCLMRCTNLLGTRYTFRNTHDLPTDRPLIIVANHQSMYDIPPIIWYLRAHHPKFVSKKELGKGIPSVSFNLRHGGSVLIDRKDSKQALREIAKLGDYIEQNCRSAVIFPEGTRSRTGHPKPFQVTGLKVLMKAAPSAVVVPISINNSWKLLRYGKFPYGLGNHLTYDIHQPHDITEDHGTIIATVEQQVVSGITEFK
ncbi:lysophospholipid acyltransferase family protein [Poritiphilus flavus]|uniref:1-acyl-sn-glycerol-3-phosphate acyltransferase n=1 Tax=Poritiphilus flavus TaxID=2697053 RepID=A0A6L9E8B2_9FLAO|nr:lysophospholipid acyltransferase family protein [Poritiphilus flavus]NAS10838.1 1-acyl-sn-glycerol-3-phosphate acyltransferase [Poritiphilus flavus]